MSLPRDLDEAAMIDGAGPFRVLRSIIVPQSIPAIVAVSLFHFFFAWNDFFLPLLYLGSKPELQPLSVGIQQYNALYSTQPTLIQATAADDDGRPGRRVLPGPTGLHARRRRHRRRQVTNKGAWPKIPSVAWQRPMGLPCPEAGHPRVDLPMIDDGTYAGIPIGGLGTGSIGRTHRGDFARWHLEVGKHAFAPVAADGFSVFVGRPGGGGTATVLSTLRPEALPAWGWTLPEGAGTYHALFPRAWQAFEPDALGVRLVGEQLSPVIAGDLEIERAPGRRLRVVGREPGT